MNVLCVGAGKEQCYAIKKAKEQGLRVVAIDRNPQAQGLNIADIGIVQDIKDVDKVIAIAKKYDIKMVIPTPIGRYLTVVGAINDELNLRGISYRSAVNCTDKVKCMQILREEKVSYTKQVVCKCNDDLRAKVHEIGLPCILKPRKGSGSRGVITVTNKGQIEPSIYKHIQSKGEEDSVIEEFIEGKEYGIDGVVENGKFKLILIRQKILTELPYRQEVGYVFPTDLSYERKCSVEELVSKSCKALNLDNCAINADVVVNKKGVPYMIEIAGRPAGYSMSSFFIPQVTDIDIIVESIKLGLNLDVTIKNKNNASCLVYHFFNIEEGYLVQLPQEKDMISNNIIDYKINIKVGDYINVVKEGRDILNRGFIAVRGDNLPEAMDICNKIMKKFVVEKQLDK